MVEYRAWSARLRRFLEGVEDDDAGLEQPVAEFVQWLGQSSDIPAAVAAHCHRLHERLQSLGRDLLALARSGAGDQALARHAELDAARDALLAALDEAMRG